MIQEIANELVGTALVVLSMLALYALSVLAHKGLSVLERLKQKDTLGILDIVTARAVAYANRELKGAKGVEKRDFALGHVEKALASKGIKMDRDEILAHLQAGYDQFKAAQPAENDTYAIDGLVSKGPK